MLWDWGNDGNVILGITRIKQRIKSPSPWCYFSRKCENSQTNTDYACDANNEALEKDVEVVTRHICAKIVNEGVNLTKAENPESQHVLWGLDRLEPNEGDLHGEEGAQAVNRAVGDVDTVTEPGNCGK